MSKPLFERKSISSREKVEKLVKEKLKWTVDRIEKSTEANMRHALGKAKIEIDDDVSDVSDDKEVPREPERERTGPSVPDEKEKERPRDRDREEKAVILRPTEAAMKLLAQSRERNGTSLVRHSEGGGLSVGTCASDTTVAEIDILFSRCLHQATKVQAVTRVLQAMNENPLFQKHDRQQAEDNLLQELKALERLTTQMKLLIDEYEMFADKRKQAEEQFAKQMLQSGISNDAMQSGWDFMRDVREKQISKFKTYLERIEKI